MIMCPFCFGIPCDMGCTPLSLFPPIRESEPLIDDEKALECLRKGLEDALGNRPEVTRLIQTLIELVQVRINNRKLPGRNNG